MRRIFLLLTLVSSLSATAQNVRWDIGQPGSAGAVTTSGSGLPNLIALPGVKLNWCNFPANAVPCTNYANTFPSISSAIPCSTATQIVLQGGNSCVATGDAQGNLGVYTAVGTYAYTLTVNGVSSGPYVVSLQGTSVVFNQTIAYNGAPLTQRQIFNLIPGTNMSIACADNAGATRTDCTFNSSGGGGGGFTAGTDLSGTSVNQTVLGSSASAFYAPQGTFTAPGIYFTGMPLLGFYVKSLPDTWTITASSGTGSTATLTIANASGWPFSLIANEYITVAGNGAYNCTQCLVTGVNSGASQVSYSSAATGSVTTGTVNMITVAASNALHKFTFNSLRSSSANCAGAGSLQLCAPDYISSHDVANSTDVTLLKKNTDGTTADTRSAQCGDDTYGCMTHSGAPLTVGGTLNVAGPIGMLSVQPVANLASKLNYSGLSVGTSGRWYGSLQKGLGATDAWGQVVIASQPGAGASVYSDGTVDQIIVYSATGVAHDYNLPNATCLTGITYTPVASGGPSFGCAGAASGVILSTPGAGQFITTISPTSVNSGFGAGNVPCASFDVNGLTDALCAADTNPYNFLASGASSFFHGWNFRFQTDMKQNALEAGLQVNGTFEVPASGQVATDLWALGATMTVAGGNSSAAGTFARAQRIRAILTGNTTLNGTLIGQTFYLPTVAAGSTLNGDIIGWNCDNASIAGTLTGNSGCWQGGGSQNHTVYLAIGHKIGGAAFAVSSTDVNSYCWGTNGTNGVVYVPTNCLHSGTGSPNGVITDSPGGMYFDRNGFSWGKTAGAATNTGWGLNLTTIGHDDATGSSATRTTQNILASTPAAGEYIVKWYIDQNAPCTTGSNSVTVALNWTDATAARASGVLGTLTTTTSGTSTGAFASGQFTLWAASATAITDTTTYVGTCATGTSTYDFHASVTREQ